MMGRTLLAILLLLGPSPVWSVPAPQRIASGTVGADEILMEILGRRHELKRLIAVSTFSANRSYSHLEAIPAFIQGRVGDSVEALLALKPDLVILASYNRQELSQQLKAAGIPVVMQEHFRNIADIMANIQMIGRVTGTQAEADALVQEMQQRLKAAQPTKPCKKGHPTFIQYTGYDTVPGADTIIDDAASHAGLQNLAAKIKLKGWAPLSLEVLATLDPDLILLAGDPARKDASLSTLRKIPAWQTLKAVQAGRLLVIPERDLNTVSQHVTKLVEILARARAAACGS